MPPKSETKGKHGGKAVEGADDIDAIISEFQAMEANDQLKIEYKKATLKKRCGSCSSSLQDEAKLICGRCKKTYYCGKKCQSKHWKIHKQNCIPYENEGAPKPLEQAAQIGPHKSKDENKSALLGAIKSAKSINPDQADMTCSTCGSALVCLGSHEKSLGGTAATASATFVCRNGHSICMTDARLGLEQECSCDVRVEPLHCSPITPMQERMFASMVAPNPSLLVVTGFNKVDETNSCFMAKLAPILRAKGVPYEVLPACGGDALGVFLELGTYNSLLFVHMDPKGMEQYGSLIFNVKNTGALYQFVSNGGRCLVQGEGPGVVWLLQLLSGKPWHFCGDFYRRCKHVCNTRDFRPFSLVVDTSSQRREVVGDGDADDDEGREGCLLTRKIDMKATMLSGVDREDQLYSPKEGTRCVSAVPTFGGHIVPTFRTAVAASRLGLGLICYIGDVNAEAGIIKTITTIITMPR